MRFPFAQTCLVSCLAAVILATPADTEAQTVREGTIPQPHLALTNANVVDVVTGELQRGVTVVLAEGRIESIGADAPPAGVEVKDLGGKFVVPGLIDAHTHLNSLASARRALATGVTTVRSASVGSFRDVALRELVADGWLAGPDVVAAGIFVTPDIGDAVLADPELRDLVRGVDTLERLRRLTRANVEHGVDVIKTRGTERAGLPDTDPRQQVYTVEELSAVVEEAGAAGVPVMAHAHGDEGGRAAVLAGVKSIEHGTYLSDETLRLMRDRGTFLVPTYSTVVDLVEPGGDYDDPVTRVRGMHMLPRLERTVQRAHEIGVRIVSGADVSYTPESVTRVSHEVANFTRLGMTPIEALQTATVNAADLLGLGDRTGRIATGFEADLIVVDENPLENVLVLQDPLLIVSNGRVAVDRIEFGRASAPIP
ncbi:MAG: amidohydrolase family protein [Gemmatimonadetes bacterium]|nr:amidohydrolase family protein [Gemmatimonadota bacterium]